MRGTEEVATVVLLVKTKQHICPSSLVGRTAWQQNPNVSYLLFRVFKVFCVLKSCWVLSTGS